MMKALFSVENNYDQPDNNLKCLWVDKPTLEELAKAMGTVFPNSSDDVTLIIVKVWSGSDERLGNTDYRLEDVKFGEIL